MLIGFDHSLGLHELFFGFVQIFGQHVKIQGQVAELVGEMHVVADVQRNVVIVDGILHEPVPARVAVAQIGLADKLSVGNIHQAVGNGDADAHVLNFVAPLIFVGPPDTGADVFARGVDPGMAGRILAEGDAAEAAYLRRIAGVVEVNRVFLSGAQRFREVDEDGAGIALVFQRSRAEKNFVDFSAGCRSSWMRVPS